MPYRQKPMPGINVPNSIICEATLDSVANEAMDSWNEHGTLESHEVRVDQTLIKVRS